MEACRTLLKKDIKQNLFLLLANWAGKYSISTIRPSLENDSVNKKHIELQYAALQAMSSMLCCGPCFDNLAEESPYYLWLDGLLNSTDEKVNITRLTYNLNF